MSIEQSIYWERGEAHEAERDRKRQTSKNKGRLCQFLSFYFISFMYKIFIFFSFYIFRITVIFYPFSIPFFVFRSYESGTDSFFFAFLSAFFLIF